MNANANKILFSRALPEESRLFFSNLHEPNLQLAPLVDVRVPLKTFPDIQHRNHSL